MEREGNGKVVREARASSRRPACGVWAVIGRVGENGHVSGDKGVREKGRGDKETI